MTPKFNKEASAWGAWVESVWTWEKTERGRILVFQSKQEAQRFIDTMNERKL